MSGILGLREEGLGAWAPGSEEGGTWEPGLLGLREEGLGSGLLGLKEEGAGNLDSWVLEDGTVED